MGGVLPPPRRGGVQGPGLSPQCSPPPLAREPLQPLLRVFQLLGRHLLGAPRDIPRVLEQFVQYLAQRPVVAALDLGLRAHALWIPRARSSARRNSCALARSVDGRPCSAR